jgi:hypothetical protein
MALLNGAAPAASTGTVQTVAQGNGVSKGLSDEAKKKAAKRAEIRAKAKKLHDALVAKGQWTGLEKELQDFVIDLHTEKKPGGGFGNFGTPVFNKLFGDNPTVGKSVTVKDVFDLTFKGPGQMTEWLKKWAAKGDVVEFTSNADLMKATYTIKALAS